MDNKKLIGFVCLGVAAVVLVFAIAFMAGRNSAKATNDDADLPADAAESAVEVEEPAAVEVPPPDDLPEMSAHAEDDYEISAGAGADYEMPIAEDAGPDDSAIAAADSADVPEDAVLDEYGMYRVPEEWAADHGGVFIERNGEIYAVSPEVPRYVAEKYGVGYSFGSDNTETMSLYLYDAKELNAEIPSRVRKAITSAGDFSILQVSRKEELRVYNEYVINEMSLVKSEYVGYTIPARTAGLGTTDYFPMIDHVMLSINRNDMNVFDTNDNLVADVHDLEYGRTYLFEYYSGTEYHEIEVVADSKCYTNPKPNHDNTVSLPLELTKFGYAAVDISSLEPGFYTLMESTVFEVVE